MSKTIMITGGTSGFGKAMAYRFAREGWNIIITGRRGDRLSAIKHDLVKEHKVEVTPLEFDVRNKEEVKSACGSLMASNPELKIDVLINNAGLASGLSTIDQGDTDDWDVMIDTNVKGLLYVTRRIAPLMCNERNGHIINIGSTAGKLVYKNGNVYCATKFAVDALTQAMRIDLLQYGIKVTGINPGMAETEFSMVRFKGDEARANAVYEGLKPLQPEDIADIAWFCTSLPRHVCINDLTVTCLTQANGFYSIKDSELLK